MERAGSRGGCSRGRKERQHQGMSHWRYVTSVEASTDSAFWSRQPPASDEVRVFADGLVRGVKAHQGEIDELIAKFAEHWDIDRMAVVDRNLLRAGIWELLWGVDVPPKVAINEALEIARRFSTEESTRFVNGLLDRVRRELCP